MTKNKWIITGIGVVVVAVIVVVVVLTLSSDEPENPSILSSLEGDVLVMKAGSGNWDAAQIGQQLYEDDILKIGEASKATVTFFDGSTIELEAGTQLEIKTLEPADGKNVNTISLEQEIGRSISRVTKLVDPASNYEIGTPSGVAAVRGTTMVVDVDEQGISRIVSEEGLVFVTAQGSEVLLSQGMQSIILPGKPPSEPTSPGGEGAGDVEITKYSVTEEGTTSFVFEVVNVGVTPQSNVLIYDEEAEDITYVSGDIDNNSILDPGETWVFTGVQTTP